MAPRFVIGIDLGGTKLAGGLVDQDLRVHHRVQRPVDARDPLTLLDSVQNAVQELINEAPGEVAAVGFGIPARIDRRTGTSVVAINLPLDDLPFEALMAERLDLPVAVDNDGNVAALAEHRGGAAVGVDDMLLLTIGSGIGGGLILNGQLYRGSIGSAAELGHMVIALDGPPCPGNCPNNGCLEAMASGAALAREARQFAAERPGTALGRALSAGRELDGRLVTELAYDGDGAALEALELIAMRLGVALSSYVNIFNPEMIVLGGGVMAAGEMILGPVRTQIAQRALPPSRDNVSVVPAYFGPEAGMIGAAALAFDVLDDNTSDGNAEEAK
jgi:glucokinase